VGHGCGTSPARAANRRAVLSETRGSDLTLWGPGVRPDPLPCSARWSDAPVVTYELGKEALDVCLRRNRRAPHPIPLVPHGFAWRSAVVPHDVDDAAKQDSSVGSRADRFAASHLLHGI
jgi:hypothetical protein